MAKRVSVLHLAEQRHWTAGMHVSHSSYMGTATAARQRRRRAHCGPQFEMLPLMFTTRHAACVVLACASLLTTAATARLRGARSAPELAPYPPLMWHSWGLFTHDDEVNEENMKAMGDALVSSGMAAAGYDTVNVVRSRSSLEYFFCAPF